MHTVESLIEHVRQTNSKIGHVKLVPNIVNHPRIGINYCLELGINQDMPDIILESDIIKYEVSNNMLWVVYKSSDSIQTHIEEVLKNVIVY